MTTILKEKRDIFMISVALGLLASFLFMLLEPAISRATTGTETQFTITQVVTSEIAFSTHAANVTMVGSLPGITGGTSNGQTQVIVTTNNVTGYQMTIVASSSVGMIGNTGGGNIPHYTPASTSIPDYTFLVPANTGEFGYSVSASTTSDLAQKFLDNGSTTCNTGSADTGTLASCWYNQSTVATSTINRTTATAASGATSTIFFRVTINANPSPAIPAATYVATSTLTIFVNP